MTETPETLTQRQARKLLNIDRDQLDDLAGKGQLRLVRLFDVYDRISHTTSDGTYSSRWVVLDQEMIHLVGPDRKIFAKEKAELRFRRLLGDQPRERVQVKIEDYNSSLDLNSFRVLKGDVEKLKGLLQTQTGSAGGSNSTETNSKTPCLPTPEKPDDIQIDHERDLVTFLGSEHWLTRNQCKCVQAIKDQYELYKSKKAASPALKQANILKKAKIVSSGYPRLDDVFKSRLDAFRTIFKKTARGEYQLKVDS